MIVHQRARRGGVARRDRARKRAMDIENVARELARERAVARRPRDVLERDELEHQHAVMRRLGDRQMEIAARSSMSARSRA